jgi:radical SAM superfamily enzyme YgiQ (UPF0313 family)
MQKKAVLVHLNGLVNLTPLSGGYLKAYALQEPVIRDNWDIQLYSVYVRTSAAEIIQHLTDARPDVIGFSVYTWNFGLVIRVLSALRGLLPNTRYILGGTEVMHSAAKLLPPTMENVVVCNGEGEKTFRDFLLQVDAASPDPLVPAGANRPDMSKVGGISYCRDGQWLDTPEYPRVRDLSELPSPWLTGVLSGDDLKEVSLIETTRGCPFACEFCYWGGAIGQKVNKLEVERIKAELDYLARNRVKSIGICDANFGMLPRDVEIAEHIVELHNRTGYPSRVMYNTAKNHAERVSQVATILHKGGLLQNQSISLQTMSDEALKLAKRENIKKDTYLVLQRRLNEMHVASFIELIWPMPGETLDSFKDGVDELCGMGAQGFVIYPLLWLNNVGYQGKEEEYGIAMLREDDPSSSGRIVIQTRDVSFRDYRNGLSYTTAVNMLQDCRGLYVTMHLLRALGIASHRDVFDAFQSWMDAQMDNSEFAGSGMLEYWRSGHREFEEKIKYTWSGGLVYRTLHQLRRDFDELLHAFMASNTFRTVCKPHEHADLVGAAFELDLLSRPYVYMQTPFEITAPLQYLEASKARRLTWAVDAQYDFPTIVEKLRTGVALTDADLLRNPVKFQIAHHNRQVLFMSKSEEEHTWHCQQVMREMGTIEPRYQPQVDAVEAEVATAS